MKTDELQAGPELDALVAEKVMGWTLSGGLWCKKLGGDMGYLAVVGTDGGSRVFAPSTDIISAWEVLQALPHEHGPLGVTWILMDTHYMYHPNDGRFYAFYACTARFDCGEEKWYSKGETAPLAICRAALKAVGVEEI